MTRTTGRRSGVAPALSGQVRRRRGVQRWHVAVALVSLALAASASLFIGVSDLTPADLLDPDEAQARVLWTSRVPRLLAILLAGSAMAVAGLVMMHLTRNRFVSPQTAGTTEWVGLGIVVATLSFGGTSVFGKMTIGVAFALVGTAFFVWLLQRLVLTDVVVVPLVGILLGGVVSAVTTFLAYRFDLLQSMDVWMNGDFSGVLAGRYELLWLVLAATVLAYLWADRFSVAGMGESFAINLGIAYDRVVTSAMHVLIACQSYGIPCALVVFEGHLSAVSGNGMKYSDYSLGAGLDPIDPAPVPLDLREVAIADLVRDEAVSEDKKDEVEDALRRAVAAVTG